MKKVLLVDDEENSLDVLEHEILRLQQNYTIIAKVNDARNAAEIINSSKPDILFLDIEMPWLSGFQLLDQLTYHDFSLIFVTAYDQYAIKAFRYYALDYLLKPINSKDLFESLKRLELKSADENKIHTQQTVSLISKGGFSANVIAFPTQNGFEFVQADDIIRCQAVSNYSKVVINDGRTILISKPLKHIAEKLLQNKFIRIHQSHLINLKFLVSYSHKDGGEIKMSDKSLLPISRSRKQDFLDQIGDNIFRSY